MRNTDLQGRAFPCQNVVSTVIVFVCFIIDSFMLHVHVDSMFGGKVHFYHKILTVLILYVYFQSNNLRSSFCSADQEVLCF